MELEEVLLENSFLSPGYNLTGYVIQGSTLQQACADLQKPPHGLMSPADAYVILSREKSLSGLFILRPFDIEVYKELWILI